MKVKIIIPSVLQKFTDNNRIIKVEGNTAGEVLDNLTIKYFLLRKQLFSDNGRIRSFINIYLNDTDIYLPEADNLPLKETDEIRIIPAIIGGIKN
jgi:sulfur-carrier protein